MDYLAVIAVFTSLGYYTGSFAKQVPLPPQPRPNTLQDDSDSESDSEDADVSALTTSDECKLVGPTEGQVARKPTKEQVLAVRTDLGMTTGKIAAQCSHATLGCYKILLRENPDLLRRWARGGYLRIVVRCSDEDELFLLQAQAQSLNLCARSIQASGLVERVMEQSIAGPVC
ncbi:peptidyl-tRNA hydrolase PTH2-domain-containing protein [Mycena filopes]|nr:peptidyl-tRNA hydrolase PTH2-domain-containing protein [Mycena filopes]